MDLLNYKDEGTCDSVTLKSADGQAFIIDAKSASRAELLAHHMEGRKMDLELSFQDIEGKILKKIADYLLHFKDTLQPSEIPKPLKEIKIDKLITKWEHDFIYSFTLQDTIDLINAANHLGINSLLKLACARIASRMLELPTDEVIRTFCIECDMSEEEIKRYSKYTLYNWNDK